MFTIDQINDIHTRLGSMNSFPGYVEALRLLGVQTYNSYLADGHSEYFGADGYRVVSEPVHEKLIIADKTDKEAFLKHLALHEQRKTNYMEMSRGLAGSGIEKWVVDTVAMTISFCGEDGEVVLVEGVK